MYRRHVPVHDMLVWPGCVVANHNSYCQVIMPVYYTCSTGCCPLCGVDKEHMFLYNRVVMYLTNALECSFILNVTTIQSNKDVMRWRDQPI